MQYASRAYDKAWESSGTAIELYLKSAEVAKAKAAAPAVPTLPEFYTVRLIPDRRDCFWRIAEYDFVYGDPWKWKILYEANKQLLPDPNNPDLILPGTRLRIPSLKGEQRSGEWQGGK
jgi:nucleoid-associated protein YgaU